MSTAWCPIGWQSACLRQAGFERVAWQRTLMYYPHEPFSWFRWFDHAPLFWFFRVVFRGANLLFGQWGNKLAPAGVKVQGPTYEV